MFGYMSGMNTTPLMWEMASEALDGEKLPESLNAAIYALKDGGALVIPKDLARRLLDAMQGWNGPLHFALASHMRGSHGPNS